MRIVSKQELKDIINKNTATVFAEYKPDIFTSDIMVANECKGAYDVVPYEGEVFSWDWNINDDSDSQLYAVFDNHEVLLMIQTLTRGLQFLTWDTEPMMSQIVDRAVDRCLKELK